MTPSPSVAPQAPTASPSAIPTASPSIDPALAGKQYLAAAGTINKASKALSRKYKTFGTLTRARAFYRKAAKLERAFSDAIRKIVFPVDMVGDVKSLLQKDAAVEALYIEASGARSWAELTSMYNAIDRADRASSAAANLVRQDLGLPSLPST